LYLRDIVSNLARPIKELRGLQRISPEPSGRTTATFVLGPDELSFLDINMQRVVESGVLRLCWEAHPKVFEQGIIRSLAPFSEYLEVGRR
jgi:hypothetical protein